MSSPNPSLLWDKLQIKKESLRIARRCVTGRVYGGCVTACSVHVSMKDVFSHLPNE